MKVYDLLAGKYNFGRSKVLSLSETLDRLPTIQQEGLRGGVLYHDGQFDDTRLLTHLLATAVDHGATVLNYAEVTATLKDGEGFLSGVTIDDHETHEKSTAHAKVVVNATGIFTDETRRLAQADVKPMVTPAQGIHLVLDRSFLRGDNAIIGAADQRRAGAVRHSLARPHLDRHHRHGPSSILPMSPWRSRKKFNSCSKPRPNISADRRRAATC